MPVPIPMPPYTRGQCERTVFHLLICGSSLYITDTSPLSLACLQTLSCTLGFFAFSLS